MPVKKQNPNRIDTLLQFLEEDPQDSFVRFALAKEYEKLGTLKKAIDTLEELKQMDKQYVGLYYHLGAMYVQTDDILTALTIYEEGINIAKKQADFHALSELHTAKQNILLEDSE